MPQPIGFSGSRQLVPQHAAIIASFAGQAARAGQPILTGCATGADQAAIVGALTAGAAAQLTIFAAFGPAGAGACASSAVAQVEQAGAAGAAVQWWAGGGPQVPIKGRLVRRARAFIAALHTAGGSLVAFPASAVGRGTWGEVGLAITAGVPVFVFPCFTGPLPIVAGGSWLFVAAGPFTGSFAWQPGASQPVLL